MFTHELLQARLQELALPVTADALHGALCGLTCAGIRSDDAAYLEHLATSLTLEPVLFSAHLDMLAALQTLIAKALADSDLSFQPLLPDGEEFLSLRVQALARWAESFVQGVLASAKTWSADDRDVLEDIAAIALLDDEDADAAEDLSKASLNDPAQANDNEADFVALTEFVRMAAIEIFREHSEPSAAPASDTVH